MTGLDGSGDAPLTHTLIIRAVDETGGDCAQAKVTFRSEPSSKTVRDYETFIAKAFRSAFEKDYDRLASALLPYSEEHDDDA